MSNGGGMEENEDRCPRPPDIEEGSGGVPVAVAFVPPPREFMGSISTCSEAGISVGSCTPGEDLPFPDFLPISFGCLRQTSRLRFFCLSCIQNPWFERVCMMVILLNCITLGMYQPCIDDVCDTYRCQILSKFDDVIFAYFALEMSIKMIAMGVTGKGAYLAESWNRLDFFIVAAGVVEYCLVLESNINLSAIRTIRVLRPLRAINRIPSMRILVMLLLDTLPMLGNVLLLCFFVFFIFGIVGVQLWKGILRQRCYLPDNMTHYGDPITNYYNVTEQEKDYICSLPKDNGMHRCEHLPPMKHTDSERICTEAVSSLHSLTNDSCVNWNQYYTECRHGKINPFQGTISFDNIGSAWVAIFLVISLEGWSDIMYYIQDAHSFWDFIYFVLLIVIGSFFMINLCLVVIATQFSETKKREIERMRQERARFQSTSTLASGSMSDQTSCYAEIIKYIGHLYRRGRRTLRVKYLQYKKRWRGDRPPKKLSLKIKRRKKMYEYQGDNNESGGAIIVPSGNFTSGPITVYNNVVGSSAIITTPEIIEPRSLPTNLTLNSPDMDLELGSPNRPAMLRFSRGGADTHSINEHLSPSPGSGGGWSPRRRSSVMFSDVVLYGNICDITTINNVCLSEKTTQTEPEEPLDPALFLTGPHGKATVRPPSSKALALPENKGSLTCGELLALSGALSAALPAHLGVDAQSVQTLYSSLAKGVKHFSAPSLFYPEAGPLGLESGSETSDSMDSDSDWTDEEWSEDEEVKSVNKCLLVFITIRGWIKKLTDHRYFSRGILLAILINTLSMGVEYHNQPDALTQIVEVSNILFSGVFAIEMLLKVIAEGPFGYISNGFNVFDGIIVILSVFEMYESHMSGASTDGSNQGSSLSVLRTFRLLRILKLVRFMPQLRRQLFVMLRTMDNVAIFFSLLILFIFIFSILGMNLFGCKFCSENPDKTITCDRKNFDSLLWASITVFQILTQEDWNIVLFNGMEKTSHWASLYFIALMTFGNYVLFNLLVAILVEGFSAEEEKKRSRSSLEVNEDDKKMVNTNEETLKENQLRQKLIMYDEPKCNIEKENQLLQLPRSHPEIDRSLLESSSYVGTPSSHNITVPYPPIITHTAATPQGSPHATLEANRNFDHNFRLSPAMALSKQHFTEDRGQRESRSASIKSNNASLSSRPASRQERRRDSLSPRDPQRSVSLTPSGSFRDRSHSSSGGSPWRRSGSGGSSRRRRIQSTSSNGSKKHTDCQSLVQDSGSEEDEPTLNNNVSFNNLNNLLPSPSGIDHSQCNGSMGAGGGIGSQRRSILTQQNSIGSPRTLSPQNSIRSSSRQQQSQQRQINEPCNVAREKEGKTTNLEAAKQDGQYEIEGSAIDSEIDIPDKIFWIIEPKGCFLKRHKYALFIFSPTNPIRRLCHFCINQNWFDSAVLFLIGLNCITLAMERPNIPPDSGERIFLNICNDLFTVAFGLEMLVKVIAMGLLYGKGAYFSSGWNIMDGILVIISVVDILMALLATTTSRIFGILRVFRLLRALRPLRVINRAPGLKLVVQTLLSSLQPIGNIVLICCTFFIIFGILGVQLFKGSFFYCEGPSIVGVETKDDCMEMDPKNRWLNRIYNFDNLGQALMALFVLSSKDGWVNIMYTGLDAVGVNKQPKKNYSQWRLLYFISFLLLVGFFVLNMFVGVVVENFHRCREEQEKEEKARKAAKRAKKIEKKRKKMREPPYWSNYSRTRLFIYNMVTSKYFDLAIAAVIGLNVVTMALEFYQMPLELEYALQIFNYFFTAVFIMECGMKVVALGCKRYIKDNEEARWNQLDIGIVILSIVGIVLEEMKNDIIPINPTIIRVMRVLRIARVLKLLKMAKGIRALLDTVMQALPQVGNLGLLFFLLFFIFAALGVELFGSLECDEDYPCEGLGEHAHFKNFGMAFLTLFRVATGDNWNGIMKDTIRDECSHESNCVKNCCLYPFVAPIFFVIFVLMAQFVLVNVVVAVLMKHLEESHKQMEDDYDLEVEIERQIAQEEEDMLEMQENITNMKLAQERMKKLSMNSDKSSSGLSPKPVNHRPVAKVPSLPDNFIYRGHRGSDPTVGSHRGSSIYTEDLYQKKDFMYAIPSININGSEPKRRESVQITLYPRERRISTIQRAHSMGKDERLPPHQPEYKVEVVSPKPIRHSPLPSTSQFVSRENSPKISHRLTRERSSKRVKIDPRLEGPREEGCLSDRSHQRQKQMKWHGRRKSSGGGGHKMSTEDSFSQSLMASFEISGRMDVDSTSCSVCSSEDASSGRGNGLNSPRYSHSNSPLNVRRLKKESCSPRPRQQQLAPVAQSIDQLFDDDDDTIASSTDSLTIESIPPDPSSHDSNSSLSEAAANLPIPPSPPFPRRTERQVRSVHGLRPRPRPIPKQSLSSSLNELPQQEPQRRQSVSPSVGNEKNVISAPHSPNLQRRNSFQKGDPRSDSPVSPR